MFGWRDDGVEGWNCVGMLRWEDVGVVQDGGMCRVLKQNCLVLNNFNATVTVQ